MKMKMKNKTASFIRFNYPYVPYIWIIVPRKFAEWVARKDVFIDSRIGRNR